VPEVRRKASNKLDPRSTHGCFIGYLDTMTMLKIWDFERKCFVNSHDLIFDETQFPKPSDFNELLADPHKYTAQSPVPEPRQIYDEIIVQLPSALQVFSSYGNF
jgi:hypothetical protein